MRHFVTVFWVLALSAPLAAQVMPQPDSASPRLQTVRFAPDQPVVLTMLPDTPLTVMLEPGETITGVTPGVGDDFRVRVSSEANSFMILPTEDALTGALEISTQERSYRFALRVEQGYAAALLVRFVDEQALVQQAYDVPADPQIPSSQTWLYRLRGDREVRPESLSDDGSKTRIAYAPGQALPAVFAIGPTGEEEVVNGYMRDGMFVIDRVYDELVFRIDREKATARRNDAPEGSP